MIHSYRLGFAVKILGAGGLRTSDARRWQSQPHLRVSQSGLDLEQAFLDGLDDRSPDRDPLWLR